MYVQEISIEINSKANQDDLVEQFDLLISYYRGSGQTQGRIQSQYITKDKTICLVHTLEEDSLKEEYNNFYVNKQIKKLEELYKSPIQFKTLGKYHNSYQGTCNCIESEFYILITNYVSINSPITCGTCNKHIPLYRLPVFYDYGYMPILSWETNYISCDNLQMNCQVGERWALGQMQNIESQLSKQGFEICSKVEELSSIPTYYYLHNYRKMKGDQLMSTCPGCNGKWNLKEPLFNFYDFKCDKCRIVSVVSPNV